MAYQNSGLIQATSPSNDFNELVALVNAVYGDGSGDFGYGQTPEVSTVAPGDLITAAQWTALFQALTSCMVHQGTPNPDGVPSSVAINDIIDAFDTTNGTVALIDAITNNRFDIAGSEEAITAGGTKLKETRTDSWTQSVTHVFRATFGNQDQARYFFNAGGEIHWNGTYAGAGLDESGEETEWTAALDALGTVRMGHNYTTSDTGSTAIGYYDLTQSFQVIASRLVNSPFNAGYYSTEEIRVEARVTDTFDNILEFRVTFITDSGVSGDRVLNGTLESNVDQRRAVASNPSGPGVTTGEPAYSTETFTGS